MRRRLGAPGVALLLAFVCLPAGALATGEASRLLSAASDAHAAGRYEEAAAAYAELTWMGGSRNADLWYNAGNAYARAGWRGAAIGSYRQALALAPSHTDAAANLAYLRRQIDVGVDAPQPSFLLWLLAPFARLPVAFWQAVAATGWVGAWLLAALTIRREHPWLRRVRWVAVAICAGGLAGWGAVSLKRGLEPRAIVVAAVAPLRTGPGPDYLETYALPDGAETALLARQAGWVQLRLADGATGWTEAERVLVLPASGPQPGRPPTRWESDAAA